MALDTRKLTELAHALQQFDTDYGYSVTSAMAEKAWEMREAARVAHEAFEHATETPERAAAQDASVITVLGLKHSASLFRENAKRYDDMSEAWEALMTLLETIIDDE